MLAKSVLLATPRYFIQSAMILIGVCKKLEQILRKFVWGLTSSGIKASLVKWDTYC